jgi:hypothetical protein
MKTYAKITADGRTRIVRIDRETDALIIGMVVDTEGQPVERETETAMVRETWMIDKRDMTKRVPMVMNLTYGTLENA